MRKLPTNILLLFCLFTVQFASAQKDVFKLVPRKDAVIVFRLAICNKLDDEYCLVSQEIYIRGKKYLLGGGSLYQRVVNAQNEGKPGFNAANAKAVTSLYNANTGYKKVTGTRYFAQEVLASGNGWRRNKGGATFVAKTTDGYNWSTIYIAYKVKGNFAFSGEALAPFYDSLLMHHYNPNENPSLYFPIVEVLSIESFSALSKKEARRVGLSYQPLPYYRLKTIGLEDLFDQTGKGQRDN